MKKKERYKKEGQKVGNTMNEVRKIESIGKEKTIKKLSDKKGEKGKLTRKRERKWRNEEIMRHLKRF